jgi:YidC/Oxa1 family membrane protein insertase
MEKRVILAVALCVGILFVWTKYVQPPPAPTPSPSVASPGEAGARPGKDTVPGAPAVAAAPGDATTAGRAAVPAGVGAPSSYPEELTTLTTASQRFVFSSRGASLRHVTMREPKYLRTKNDPDSGVDVLRTASAQQADFRVAFPDSGFATPPDDAWHRVDSTGRDEVVYRAEVGAVAIEKRFRLDGNRYRVHLDVTIDNRSAKSLDHHLAISVFGHQDPEAKGGFLSGSTGNTANILCHVNDKTERTSIESIEKEPFEKIGAVSWLGADEKFFLAAAVPYPETPARERKCGGKANDPHTAEGQLSFAERQLAPGAQTQYAFAIFVGPKVISDLDEVRPGGTDVKLTEACDVSLAFISRPMLSLLKIFHGVVGNWGVAIILLTVFIKLLTFYPTQKSLLSAKKMQKLGPKMAAIRKKYENDKQRQSVETMNLYKANGVSPFGGCLPSLIQMPIWIALYSTLNYAVELYRSPFMLHIHDLTAKDPYYITPLLMGGVMFIQMKMSPTSPDNQQQATMAVMMPVMFTAFSLVLPSGLAVYMLTSYLIGIVQQLLVNYLDRRSQSGPAPAVSRG